VLDPAFVLCGRLCFCGAAAAEEKSADGNGASAADSAEAMRRCERLGIQ